jgi:hypothetical protein
LLSAILDFFRRPYSVEHHLGIGGLCQCLCLFVAVIALVWVVEIRFGARNRDFRDWSFCELFRTIHPLQPDAQMPVIRLGS